MTEKKRSPPKEEKERNGEKVKERNRETDKERERERESEYVSGISRFRLQNWSPQVESTTYELPSELEIELRLPAVSLAADPACLLSKRW